MKLIAEMSDMIDDEIQCAGMYAEKALELKRSNPDVAKVMNAVSISKLDDITALHNAVVAIIEAYRKEHGEPPAPMMAVYDYLHKKQINNLQEVKMKQGAFKEA